MLVNRVTAMNHVYHRKLGLRVIRGRVWCSLELIVEVYCWCIVSKFGLLGSGSVDHFLTNMAIRG
jgi:hypothetical protein